MFLWIPLLIVIPLAAILVAGRGVGSGDLRVDPPHGVSPIGAEPMDTARLRLARGEISAAEFETVKRVLG